MTPTSGHPIALTTAAGSAEIDSLIWIQRWAAAPGQPVVLGYSFPSASSLWSTTPVEGYGLVVAGTAEPWTGLAFVADADKPAFRSALSAWAAVANIVVGEVPDNAASAGDIRFAYTTYQMPPGQFGFAWFPSPGPKGGDVWLNASSAAARDIQVSSTSQAYSAVLHELGHALGLEHPFEDPSFPAQYGSRAWSTMHYASTVAHPDAFPDRWPTTPMPLDIEAIQHLYGPNLAHNAGDTVYDFAPGVRYFQTIWDGGGIDTIRWNGVAQPVVIDLTPGSWSHIGEPISYLASGRVVETRAETVHIYKTVLIESAVGGGAGDVILGNAAGNFIRGGGGADVLSGQGGADWIEGEAGSSALPDGHPPGPDSIAGGEGSDTVLAGGGGDLVSGDGGDDTILGEDGGDVVYGGDGQDALDGGAGGDVLYGGLGLDVIFGADDSDTLYGGEHDDTIMGERGDPAAPGALDILYGEGGNDLLSGGAGNDWIFGGDGNDVIAGGEGSDYIVGGPGIEYMLGSGPSAFGPGTEGTDLFVYLVLVDAGDHIWGFDTRPGTGDGIHLRPLLDGLGYAGTTPRPDGWMTVTAAAAPTDSVVWIDPDGGANSFTPLLTLYGVAPATLTDSFFLV